MKYTMEKLLSKLLYLSTILFILEIFLGFNGKMLILFGIPIRYILFGIVAFGLLINTFSVLSYKFVNKNRINKEYNEKNILLLFMNFLQNYFTGFDFVFAIFLVINLIYVFHIKYK